MTDRMRQQGDNAAAAVLCVSFACGCTVGAAVASHGTAMAMTCAVWSLRESLFAVLPWSVSAVLLGLFVSAGVSLPLLAAFRGCTVGCTVTAFLSSFGAVPGLTLFFADCGIRCLLSVLSVFAVAVPCLSDTLLRLRLRTRRRLCVPNVRFLYGTVVSVLLSVGAVLADRYLQPILAELLL